MLQTRRTPSSHLRILYVLLFGLVSSTTVLAESLDCNSPVTVGEAKYDLKSLDKEHKLEQKEETPPTTNVWELRFNVCKEISKKEGVSDSDQCPSGTRACLVKNNKKEKSDDRIITVIPLAKEDTLNPTYSVLKSPDGLSIQLHGDSYPSASGSKTQSLNLTLQCSNDGDSDPKFLNYAPDTGVMSVEWKTKAGCVTKSDSGGNDDKGGEDKGENEESSSGSGIGWFFLLLLISFIGYFVIGAYYNYNNFGATGWDLVPHRDFWREVPYLLKDFGDHICLTLRPGRQTSRRGYMAV